MVMKDREFGTNRLLVKEWRSFSSRDWRDQDLAQVVSEMLTENMTRSLPPAWQGKYTIERGRKWIKERDEKERRCWSSTGRPYGLSV